MQIGELSNLSGFTRDTIRYYEKLGLLNGQISRSNNNYKNYSDKSLQTLNYISFGKKYGLSLSEIKELLDLYEKNTVMCKVLEEKALSKISSIDAEIKRLLQLKKTLISGLRSLEKCL